MYMEKTEKDQDASEQRELTLLLPHLCPKKRSGCNSSLG